MQARAPAAASQRLRFLWRPSSALSPFPSTSTSNESLPRSLPRRTFTIRTTPSASSTTSNPSTDTAALQNGIEPAAPPESTQTLHDPTAAAPSSTFTTIGPTSSLLSVSLSASQPLHTRRGRLLSFSGPPEHTTSTLAPLQPFRRAIAGLPFLFQRLTSASPVNLLLSAPSPATSFVVLSLDGRIDWKILRRKSLVAWTGSGSSLSVTSQVSTNTPGIANLVQQTVTGRGLVALAAGGGSYEVKLRDAEEYLAHPSHVVAYSVSSSTPTPYRLSHTRLRLAVPSIGQYLPDSNFVKAVRESQTFRLLGRALFQLRQWMRIAIWGERVFLRFRGPSTIVLQGRHGGLMSGTRDAVTEREVNEWADGPAGALHKSMTTAQQKAKEEEEGVDKGTGVKQEENVTYASIGKDGKVAWTRD